MIYDSALDETAIPSAGAFSVTAGGVSQTITAVAVAGRVVTLTLASPVSSAEVVTVSYMVPAAEDAARIKNTNGDAAEGFADRAVVIPPDPPTITSVESSTGGLAVAWSAVADVSGYDLAWRQDGETAWQSTRTGQQQHTIGDLADGALYWVRARGVETHGGLDGQTIYTTTWSTPRPGIAGDWKPRNLQVTPGDRSVTATWDTVAGADDYEFEWQPKSDAGPGARSTGGGSSESSHQARSGSATPRNVLPPPPATDAPAWSPIPVEPDASRWSATITGLDNGEDYSARVRALRRLQVDPGEATERNLVLYSGWVNAEATPALAFEVAAGASGPQVVWSGGKVTWTVKLRHAGSLGPVGYQPFANQPIRGRVFDGPSMGTSVRCVPTAAVSFELSQTLNPACVTDDEGKVTLEYRAAVVRTNGDVGVDELVVFRRL